jgi:hypothetical protein
MKSRDILALTFTSHLVSVEQLSWRHLWNWNFLFFSYCEKFCRWEKSALQFMSWDIATENEVSDFRDGQARVGGQPLYWGLYFLDGTDPSVSSPNGNWYCPRLFKTPNKARSRTWKIWVVCSAKVTIRTRAFERRSISTGMRWGEQLSINIPVSSSGMFCMIRVIARRGKTTVRI